VAGSGREVPGAATVGGERCGGGTRSPVSRTPTVVTPGTDEPSVPAAQRRQALRTADGLFVVGLVSLIGYAAWLGRGLTFFSDEWPIIASHYNGRYLIPYDGHLLLIPIAIYHALFVTVGLSSYGPYVAVGLACYALFAALFYAYLRGRTWPLLAAVATLTVVWFSTAQLNVLFPLALNFSLPVAAMVTIWLLLDRDRSRLDIVAGVCLAISLANGGVGLVPVAAVAVELLLTRAPLRRWVPFVVPSALWCVWYLKYHTSVSNPNSIGGTLRFTGHQIQATFAGFVGGSNAGGYVLAIAAGVIFLLALTRWHTFNARAAGALTAMVVFAALTGYAARHGSLPAVAADTPRYLWVDAFFIVAALVEVIRPLRISAVVPVGVAAVVLVVGAVTLVGNLRSYHEEVVRYKHTTRTFMLAVEAIPDRIDRQRIMPFSFNVVRAGQYLTAVNHLGSPLRGVTLHDLGTESERSSADGWMIQDLGLAVTPTVAVSDAGCTTVSRAAIQDLRLPRSATVRVRAGTGPADVSLRRLAGRFPAPLGQVPDGVVGQLRIPRDHSTLPWFVRVRGAGATALVCR
jgi:hypothetical protein